jgi:cycloeucalenol cycloisomerase
MLRMQGRTGPAPLDEVRSFERAVLLYSPLWMAVVAGVGLSGALAQLGDLGHLGLGVGLALPVALLPFLLPRFGARLEKVPLAHRYASRAVLFLAGMTFIQMWLGSLLFFDRLGMEYHFHVGWTLNRSPIFLYPLTLAYFATYYVVMEVVLKRLPQPGSTVGRLLLLAAISYAVAFAETAVMASPWMRSFFFYRDKAFMLRYGSLCYGTVFFVSLPGYLALRAPKTLGKVAVEVLWRNALILVLYLGYALVLPHLPGAPLVAHAP